VYWKYSCFRVILITCSPRRTGFSKWYNIMIWIHGGRVYNRMVGEVGLSNQTDQNSTTLFTTYINLLIIPRHCPIQLCLPFLHFLGYRRYTVRGIFCFEILE
jgi:hypothetical protein